VNRLQSPTVTLLIIQIPCLDEESTLPLTLSKLPRYVSGFDQVQWLVIDDGSQDRTVEVARAGGVDHVVRHTSRKGLARAFATGLDSGLRLGADVIVNLDADDQYDSSAIPALVAPILAGTADMVIGTRDVDAVAEFSASKKVLQKLGSWVVRRASGLNVPDATSGFRAFSREAALRINVLSGFTYTLESLIQAGSKNVTVTTVPVATNPKRRESRLFRTSGGYILRSAGTILQMYTLYRPMRPFVAVGAVMITGGTAIGLRFLFYFLQGHGEGKVQSLLLAAILTVVGAQTVMTGIVAELIGLSRKLSEDTLLRVRRLELGAGVDVSLSRTGTHRLQSDATQGD
jgi:glycosyltransferase involved in cell wall biosynthesis